MFEGVLLIFFKKIQLFFSAKLYGSGKRFHEKQDQVPNCVTCTVYAKIYRGLLHLEVSQDIHNQISQFIPHNKDNKNAFLICPNFYFGDLQLVVVCLSVCPGVLSG